MGLPNIPLWGFPMETLKKLSVKPLTSIGIVTHRISSRQVGEVSPFGTSRCGASTEVPSTHLAPDSLIIFEQQTRTMFNRVESSVRNIRTHCWGVWTWLTYQRHNGLCLSWKINYPMHCDLYLWVPSQWGKEPHCFQTKVTLYLWLPNSVSTKGVPKCNRLWAVCVSPWVMGFGWTPFFDQKGQFFPPLYSWCGAFNPNMHIITDKLKTACVWTGWGLRETQK